MLKSLEGAPAAIQRASQINMQAQDPDEPYKAR